MMICTHHYNCWRDEHPGGLPQDARVWVETKHEAEIVKEAVDTIDPGHHRNFEAAEDEGRVGGRVVVHQLKHVHPTLRDHEESAEVHEAAHAQGQPFPVLSPQCRKLVLEDGDNGLCGGELGAKPEGEKHQEEEYRPEWRDWHPGDGLRIGNECQSSTLSGDFFNRDPQFMGHVTNDAKDDKSGKEACDAIAHSHEQGIPEDIVVELIVAGEGDHAAPGDAEGEEDLDAGVRPHVDLEQFLPLWSEVESDSVHVSGQGGCTDQENDEDAVREEGGEVDQLSKGLDPLPQGTVDDGPCQKEAKS